MTMMYFIEPSLSGLENVQYSGRSLHHFLDSLHSDGNMESNLINILYKT